MVEGLRPYQDEDLARVVQFVGECNLRSDCAPMHSGDVRHLLSNILRGQNPAEHVHLCEDDSGVVALVTLYPARFGFFDLVVHPERRGGDLERGLIAWGEEAMGRLIQTAGGTKAVGCDTPDCDGTRRELLAEAGYQADAKPHQFYTTRPLAEPIPESVLPDGFTIRAVEGEHEAEALSVVHSGAFGSNWTAELYRTVMRSPAFQIDHELVVVAPDGRLAAFTVYWADAVSRTGMFEPVGCHADFQRMGLTKALLYEGMRRMAAEGMETASVRHEADNAASTALYRSVGFRAKFGIFDYRKSI